MNFFVNATMPNQKSGIEHAQLKPSNMPKEMGLRHRSGLGMAIETDALVIIVSEERGKITVAHKGKLTPNISAEELQRILSAAESHANIR